MEHSSSEGSTVGLNTTEIIQSLVESTLGRPRNQNHVAIQFDLSITESIPLLVLVLESVCGVLCNGSVLLLFCVRKYLLRTASDLFTINLSVVDLLFSGIVLPIVIISSLMEKSLCDNKTKLPSTIEVSSNCIVLFGTIATALGTLLVSLDRGDVSLKPSKRFFTQARAITAIIVTWSIASLGLIIAIIPSLFTIEQEEQTLNPIMKPNEKPSLYLIEENMNNDTESIFLTKKEEPCCRMYPCNAFNTYACTFQLLFEIPVFLAAITTIVVIYGKILWSVQRRSKRYITHSSRGSMPSKMGKSPLKIFSQLKCCTWESCDRRRQRSEKSPMSNRSEMNNSTESLTSNDADQNRSKSKSAMKYTTTNIGEKIKKQDSLEDALFVPATSKNEIRAPNTVIQERSNAKTKTDFASVAMSVTVVLAIKRMAARKIKERKKKMRHLKKMTFLIIFTFLFCWTPYYMTKLSIAIKFQWQAPDNGTNPENISGLAEKRCTPGWVFTWMLAIAALSCILNPALYMFSRDKIRLEFTKTFFSSCTKSARGSAVQDASCFTCWDTDESKPKKRAGSIFVTGWDNKNIIKSPPKTSKDGMKQSRESSSTRRLEGPEAVSENSRTLQGTNTTLLPRWQVVVCDSIDDMDEDEQCNDHCQEPLNPEGLMLPSISKTRTGSFSARSVDLMSCSTSASIMGDII